MSQGKNLEAYLATAAEMLISEGMSEAAKLLQVSSARIEQTGYDNWNGGTNIWTIYLSVDAPYYVKLGSKRETLQEQVGNRLESIMSQFSSDWYSVEIVPKVEQPLEWRNDGKGISEATRQSIIDGLRIDKLDWHGRLGEVEFLERLYDLQSMPSTDHRFNDAAGDIWQHRVNNEDWPDHWVFEDSRFNLVRGSSDNFLRFICAVIHPLVRQNREDSLRLLREFNAHLHPEGWVLVEEEKIAGRTHFVARRIQAASERSVTRARTVADALDAGWMQKEIERLESAVDRDPSLAIGTAKDLLESCCKSILTKQNVPFSRNTDLPELTKLVAKELKLVPEGIPDEARGSETIRLILRNLTALTQYLAELRGLYGSGHGRDGKHRGLEPRHARLAVGAAVAFIDFVTETYSRRSSEK